VARGHRFPRPRSYKGQLGIASSSVPTLSLTQLLTMRTSILAAALLAAVAPALAADNRQLYTHAKSDPTTFCNTWRCAWYVPYFLLSAADP
jgi:hypothetical protein